MLLHVHVVRVPNLRFKSASQSFIKCRLHSWIARLFLKFWLHCWRALRLVYVCGLVSTAHDGSPDAPCLANGVCTDRQSVCVGGVCRCQLNHYASAGRCRKTHHFTYQRTPACPPSPFNRHIKTARQRTSNTVIGTLAVDGWAVTFGTARRGLGGLRPTQSRPEPNVTAHPSTASVPTSYY